MPNIDPSLLIRLDLIALVKSIDNEALHYTVNLKVCVDLR
jgi:hypothetical protein